LEAIELEITGDGGPAQNTNKGEEETREAEKKAETVCKEKSVLQGKLTTLAIQIGYGGQSLSCQAV
jgi:hypothetical protein